MISKRDISKIAKKVLRRQKGVRDHHIIHPEREWAIGLLGGLLLLVLGGAWSVSTYQDVSERTVENAETTEIKQTIYRGDIVETALEELNERNTKYLNMIEDYRVSAPEIVEEEEEEPEEESTSEEVAEVITEEESAVTVDDFEIIEETNSNEVEIIEN